MYIETEKVGFVAKLTLIIFHKMCKIREIDADNDAKCFNR